MCVVQLPKEQPVIEDHATNWFNVQKMGIFSTTAERREVIIKFPDNKFCAEPPPDVAESLVTSLSLLAQGSAKDETSREVTARLEATKSLATSIRTLFTRSQGAQFLRDGLFHLCQAYLNHAITEAEYVALYKEVLTESKFLIWKEIPDMKDKRAADAADNAAAEAAKAKTSAMEAATSAEQAKKDAVRAETAKDSAEQKAKMDTDRAETAKNDAELAKREAVRAQVDAKESENAAANSATKAKSAADRAEEAANKVP